MKAGNFLCLLQHHLHSQLEDLLSASQIEVDIGDEDDNSIEKQIKEVTQQLLQKQQDLMAAQSCADKARQAEAEASEAWQAKRYHELVQYPISFRHAVCNKWSLWNDCTGVDE